MAIHVGGSAQKEWASVCVCVFVLELHNRNEIRVKVKLLDPIIAIYYSSLDYLFKLD